MSDLCEHCTARGALVKCQDTHRSQHSSWMVKEILKHCKLAGNPATEDADMTHNSNALRLALIWTSHAHNDIDFGRVACYSIGIKERIG